MPVQTPGALPTSFSDRFARSLAKAEAFLAGGQPRRPEGADLTASPEYREILMLKVKLELEVARILSSAARLSAELSEAADGLRSEAEEARR